MKRYTINKVIRHTETVIVEAMTRAEAIALAEDTEGRDNQDREVEDVEVISEEELD